METKEQLKMASVIRESAEVKNANELQILRDEFGSEPKPENWRLPPQAVVLFVVGGKTPKGNVISPKYFGARGAIEQAVSTLLTDSGLLLYGLPGTAKSWVSENLAAAISGDSTLVVQGSSGTDESALRYGWNYAQLIANGPTMEGIVKSSTMRAMEEGKLVRIEELTRISSDVQDALISIMSEKTIAIPELDTERKANKGFNIIATANNRDRGVNELSSALRRRFITVTLAPPTTLEEEVRIVTARSLELGRPYAYPAAEPASEAILRVATIVRELRNGVTIDGKERVKQPSGTLSTAEAISIVNSAWANAAYFGNGEISARDLARALVGAVVQDLNRDVEVWNEYVSHIMKGREEWQDLYKACKEIRL